MNSISPKPALIGIRIILAVAAVLVTIAGIQLFVLTAHTDRYFAWTIASSLTAAFMGAAYWASVPLLLYGVRQTLWANLRASFISPLVFTTAMTVASLQHLGQFHFGAQSVPTARVAAWAWTAVYVLVPVIELVLLPLQLRLPGSDPPRGPRIWTWLLALLAAQAVLMTCWGLLLFFAPAIGAPLWPWKLTPLTAQVVGGWLLGLAVAAFMCIYENDRRRIIGLAASYAAFGLLQLIAIVRYPAAVAWNRPWGAMYVAFMITVLLAGVCGYAGARSSAPRAAP